MHRQNKHTVAAFAALFTLGSLFTQCTKSDKSDAFVKGDAPPVAGGFVNSSEIATANLVAHFPFDGSVTDCLHNLRPSVYKWGLWKWSLRMP